MIGLDTNVLVRLMVDDGTEQTTIVRNAVRLAVESGKRCFVNRVALVEFVWVMESVYDRPKSDIRRLLDAMLDNDDLCIKDSHIVADALTQYRKGPADFADSLISLGNQHCGCATTLTFDRKASRLPEFQLVAEFS